MKRLLPALRAPLVLILALALTLAPLGSAMAAATYFEYEPILASQLFRTYEQLEMQWFEDDDYRALFAACLMVDASTESGWFDVNWDYPVIMVSDRQQYNIIYIDEDENACNVIYAPAEGLGCYSGLATDDAETVFFFDSDGWSEEGMITYGEKLLGRGIDYGFISLDDFKLAMNAIGEQLSK